MTLDNSNRNRGGGYVKKYKKKPFSRRRKTFSKVFPDVGEHP